MGELHIDPLSAVDQAGKLREAQQCWVDHLGGTRPSVPASIFGAGLQAKAKQFLSLVDQGHTVRLNHAKRLAIAGDDLVGLVGRVGDADMESSASLNAGEGWT